MNDALLSAYRDNVCRIYDSRERKLVVAYWFNRFHAVGNHYPRKGPNPAAEAIVAARQDVASGKARYASSPWRKPVGNGTRTDGKQWIEDPAAMGLRFVGYCDEIDKRIKHTGWFTDAFQDSKIRGCVYQLPGRGGKSRFVAAHDNEDNGDANIGGPAYVDFSEIYVSDFAAEMRLALRQIGKQYQTPAMLNPGYWAEEAHETAKKEAAYAADQFTESRAEAEREYQTAWQAGSMYRDCLQELADIRVSVLQTIRDMKGACATLRALPDSLKARLRSSIAADMLERSRLHSEMDELKSGDYRDLIFYPDERLRAAFADGADL